METNKIKPSPSTEPPLWAQGSLSVRLFILIYCALGCVHEDQDTQGEGAVFLSFLPKPWAAAEAPLPRQVCCSSWQLISWEGVNHATTQQQVYKEM